MSFDLSTMVPISAQYMFGVYDCLQVICVFPLVRNGDLLISTVRGCLEPEVILPSDSATTVSFKCPIHIICLT